MTEPMAIEQRLSSFEEHVTRVLRQIRGSVSMVLGDIGLHAPRPRTVTARLGLDKSLARKIANIVLASDIYHIAEFVPGSGGVEIMLDAALKAGVSEELTANARRAFSEFERLVELHAGDRSTLDVMVKGLALGEGEADVVSEIDRKAHFRSMSSIWAVQARVHLKADFIAPADTPGILDYAGFSGFVDFRRLRPQVTWELARKRLTDDEGQHKGHMKIEPLDPRFSHPDTAPLMGDFCSQPLPNIRPVLSKDGFTTFEIGESPIGLQGAVTCITGVICRSAARIYQSENNKLGEHILHLRTPSEVVVFDLFIHQDLPFHPPKFTLYSQLELSSPYPQSGRNRAPLPMAESVEFLGAPPVAVAIEMPRHVELVQRVMDRAGWNMSEFRGYRVRIPYPPIPSAAVLRFDLPEHPQ